ncbi:MULTISPECIES: hypothetical protein [Staphylococcus]|jgi:hypothetical protein|uniref:hypothetical protein n=1 Tax=Staphylococcus TaxID=1279 RepID=UPI000BC2FDE9|nr:MULTISPECIES: hypothetical protein [Staphylococcus]ATH60737.1 hypothetical protein BJD96_10710 [Staphylococcus nepalensis]ATH65784.1 hypothetical protein BJG89_10810 [Staphylococcus nepalensis]AWI45160.1 hypothetical protein BJG88_10605 [Staphylococcus nepalensis]MCY1037481.1 hypothetical protein [Staphylococcus nepalensis]MDR5648847.1 hypothetical protein [Staphylococcus nepalensis]
MYIVKLLNVLSILCSLVIIIVIIYGVIMMIGDLMGITTFNNQLLIVGLAFVLLSGLFGKSRPRLSMLVLFIGFIIVVIN